MVELEEFEPGRWRVKKDRVKVKRRAENMPLPYVISDIMEPTEQVDGKFYTSKRQFRAVGRALGLIEVGNETFHVKPKTRASASRAETEKRARAVRTAVEKFKSR
jgi:hypothetical protein